MSGLDVQRGQIDRDAIETGVEILPTIGIVTDRSAAAS
jgi:hypothetical protein